MIGRGAGNALVLDIAIGFLPETAVETQSKRWKKAEYRMSR
jgi:hypothetical protein